LWSLNKGGDSGAAYRKETGNVYKILVGKLEGKRYLGDIVKDGEIRLE
jgi:hypothetical protein